MIKVMEPTFAIFTVTQKNKRLKRKVDPKYCLSQVRVIIGRIRSDEEEDFEKYPIEFIEAASGCEEDCILDPSHELDKGEYIVYILSLIHI